jgi:Holliday junction resolvase
MSYKYWKHKEYHLRDKFNAEGFDAIRIPLSRNVLEKTSEDVVVRDLNLIIDVKSTIGKKMITIKREDLEKISNDANQLNKIGALSFSFKGDQNNYIALNLDNFFKLVKFLTLNSK